MSDNFLSFKEYLKRLSDVIIYQLFYNKRDWIDNKRFWIQCNDVPPGDHPLIYANCSEKEPPTNHHGEHKTDPLWKQSPRFKIMSPTELLGCVFLTKTDEYASHYRARIMDVILENDNGVNRKFITQYIGWMIPIMLPYLNLIHQPTLVSIMIPHSEKSSYHYYYVTIGSLDVTYIMILERFQRIPRR